MAAALVRAERLVASLLHRPVARRVQGRAAAAWRAGAQHRRSTSGPRTAKATAANASHSAPRTVGAPGIDARDARWCQEAALTSACASLRPGLYPAFTPQLPLRPHAHQL
eukprot:4506224-Prymnesium_polylepis.2